MDSNEQQNAEAADWRSLMKPEELAAYEAGKYDNARTAPKEPSRVSRNKREVSFNPQFKEHQVAYNPELKSHYQQCLEAVDGFACVPANCEVCGHVFTGDFNEPRVTVIEHSSENQNHATVYCVACHKKPVSAPPDWRDGLSETQLKAWNWYAEEGLNQAEIAARFSNAGQSVSQSTISRLIKQVKEARKEIRR
jgi:hypothetical protein